MASFAERCMYMCVTGALRGAASEARLVCCDERAVVPRSFRNKVLVTHKHSQLPVQVLNPGFLTHRQPLPCLPPAPRRGLDCAGRLASLVPPPRVPVPRNQSPKTTQVHSGSRGSAGRRAESQAPLLPAACLVKLLNLPGLHLLVCEEKIMEIPTALGGCAACRRDAQEV